MKSKEHNMNLDKSITGVQITLAKKAKENPDNQFGRLYGTIAKEYWLKTALFNVLRNEKSNTLRIDEIEQRNIKDFDRLVFDLNKELVDFTYKPQPVKKVYITKANGKIRPLGVSIVKDRVVQEAIRLILEPIMESHFLDCSNGFRPSRTTMDSIQLLTEFLNNKNKMWWVVEGEIRGCFDNIPHQQLLKVIGKYIKDKKFLYLISKILKAGIVEKGVISKPNKGTSQAGILSPLLANIYFHEIDLYWWKKYGSLTESEKIARRSNGLGNVEFVRYADEFLLLTNGDKEFARNISQEFTKKLWEWELELKSDRGLVHINDGIDFQGFHLLRVHSKANNKRIVLVTPSKKNIDRFKDKIKQMTSFKEVNVNIVSRIKSINRAIEDWCEYYRFANSSDLFKNLDRWINERMYLWLRKKHANVSSKMSVQKYVLQTYLVKDTRGWKTWGYAGVNLRHTYETKLAKYKIKWGEQRNPYLDYGCSQMKAEEDKPIKD
ncbi:MAG: group II intron reverse transcriptase/maturase [Prochloraceae cyanobacterium]|nr:group II intron reverse transcriptase/maturase [Prochloraceae cyanobacterium]